MTSVYLDASALVPFFVEESHSERAEAFLRSSSAALVVSDFAAAEFASAIARRRRMGDLTLAGARNIFDVFDRWAAERAQRVETTSRDVASAERFLRRLDMTLRTADALNIALAMRLGTTIITFDRRMAENAHALHADAVLL